MTHAVDHVPWSADGVAAYEDWYLVDDFTSKHNCDFWAAG